MISRTSFLSLMMTGALLIPASQAFAQEVVVSQEQQAIDQAIKIEKQLLDEGVTPAAFQSTEDPWGNKLVVAAKVSIDGKVASITFKDVPKTACKNLVAGNWGDNLIALYSDGTKIGRGAASHGCFNAENDLRAEYRPSPKALPVLKDESAQKAP